MLNKLIALIHMPSEQNSIKKKCQGEESIILKIDLDIELALNITFWASF